MNSEPTLTDMLMTVLPDAHPINIAALERAIRAEIRREIAMTPDEFIASMGEPQPEPPAPPAFAVGTRVRVSERPHIRAGHTGTIVELRPEIGAVDVRLDVNEIELLFPVGRVERLTSVLASIDPLPSDPGAPAGALPAGVTREETDTHIEYTLALPQSQLKTVGVTYNKETQSNAIGIFQANLIQGSVKLEANERKALISILQAIDAEIEANNGNA